MSAKQSKNDVSWGILFEEENIIEQIEQNGFFEISSAKINERREARLMTKFDHGVKLPKIFRDNGLTIQPISRGGYIIGAYSSYFQINKRFYRTYIDTDFLMLSSKSVILLLFCSI